ncbi:tetratricopeptide repeat protein [Glaciecola siphonariae]|uniref:Tetratricopeptide repeat protein n=1 Tax=Glaciecola siphonariae TaxID=521012 RepID=A0ABV9LZV0_9ALTE
MDIKCFFVVVLTFYLLGCHSYQHDAIAYQESLLQQQAPASNTLNDKSSLLTHLNDTWFEPQTISDELLFALTDEQKQIFDAFYTHPRYAHLSAPARFSEFLTTRLAKFTYHGQTYTASEAFDKMSGNCLSLAILTTALANHAQLDIRYQRVDAAPVYEKHGNILLLSTHVRTRVYGPKPEPKEGLIITREFVVIDYFPTYSDVRGEMLSENEFFAMYHRNMAAQAIIEQDYDQAYEYIKLGLTYRAEHSETYNMLAVLYNRIRQRDSAMALYHDLLEQSRSSLNAIENYASLLVQDGKEEVAQQYFIQIEGINDNNPFQWLSLAERHLRSGQLRLAEKYAKRAAQHGHYLHEPHFALAKIYAKQNKNGAARRSLERASELARKPDDEKRYLAKLDSLN